MPLMSCGTTSSRAYHRQGIASYDHEMAQRIGGVSLVMGLKGYGYLSLVLYSLERIEIG